MTEPVVEQTLARVITLRVEVDPDGGFHSMVAELPGTRGHGRTVLEAQLNVLDALKDAMDECYFDGLNVPWVVPAALANLEGE